MILFSSVVCWDGALFCLYLVLGESGSGAMPSSQRYLWEVQGAGQLATADAAWLGGSELGEGAHSRRCSSSNSSLFFMMTGFCMLLYKSQLKGRVRLREISRDTWVHHNVLLFEGVSRWWLLKDGRFWTQVLWLTELDRLILGQRRETGST